MHVHIILGLVSQSLGSCKAPMWYSNLSFQDCCAHVSYHNQCSWKRTVPSLLPRTLGLSIQRVYLSLIYSILTGHMSLWQPGVRAGSLKGHERQRYAARCCHLQHPSGNCIVSSKSFPFQAHKQTHILVL